ncbi:MAG TPA: hypothetical protein PLN67_07635 [Acidovorax defluvii]|nr:hypothetical protein [Acidovorax defluvii]
MALTTTQKTEAYQFFIVAFGAATGVEYMNQLNDAYNAGMTTKQIVNVYTTKPQFETLYPRFDTNEQFAERLIENVVGASATAAAKTEAKADVAAALNAGWTKGDIVFQIFTNLAAKASTDAQWGKTSLMLANKVAVAQYITETQLVNTTDLTKLSSYIASVTEVAASVDAAKLAAQGANGQTFTLTTGADAVAGTAGNDTITALSIKADGAGATTFSAFDSIDGGAGSDTLDIYTTNAFNAAFPTNTTVKNVEIVNIHNAEGAAALGDASKFEGVEQLWQIGAAANVTKLAATTTAGFRNVDANIAVAAADAAATAKIALDNLGEGRAINVTSGAAGTLNSVTVAGTVKDTNNDKTVAATALNITVGKDVESLSVNTAVKTTLAVNNNGTKTVSTVDASASAGAITYNAANTVANVKTGAGADTVTLNTVATATSKTASVATGEGKDTVNVFVNANGQTGVKATADAGAGDDKINVNNTGLVGIDIKAGAGNDTVTLVDGLGSLASTDKVDGGEGTDTIVIAGKTLGAEDYITLNEVATGFEAITFTSKATLDASRIAGYKTLEFSGDSAAVAAAQAAANTTALNLAFAAAADNTADAAVVTATAADNTADLAVTNATAADNAADLAVTNATAADNAADLVVTNATAADNAADLVVTNAAAVDAAADAAFAAADTANLTAQDDLAAAVSAAAATQLALDGAVAGAAATQLALGGAVSAAAATQLALDGAVADAAATQSTLDGAVADAAATQLALNGATTDLNTAAAGNQVSFDTSATGFTITAGATYTLAGLTIAGAATGDIVVTPAASNITALVASLNTAFTAGGFAIQATVVGTAIVVASTAPAATQPVIAGTATLSDPTPDVATATLNDNSPDLVAAQNAFTVAQNADNAADLAVTDATAADVTADAAVVTATAADATADAAVVTATAADATADAAVVTATAADATADAAVVAAQTAANTAASTLSSAIAGAAATQLALDGAVADAAATQSTLDGAVAAAAATQSTLDGAVSAAAATQSTLDGAMAAAVTTETNKQDAITANNSAQATLAATLNANESTVTKVAADQALVANGNLIATAAGYVLDSDAVTAGNQTTYAGSLDITAKGDGTVITAQADSVNLKVAGLVAGDVGVTLNGDVKTASVSLTNGVNNAKAELATEDTIASVSVTASASVLKAMTTLTLTGNGEAVVTNFDGSALVTVDASALGGTYALGADKGDTTIGLDFWSTSSKSETVKLGSGIDWVGLQNSTVKNMDTVTGLNLVDNADVTGKQIDFDLSDVLVVNAATFEKVTTAATSLNLALIDLAASSSKNEVVFTFGGDTYIYADNGTDANFVDDVDVLVKVTGTADLDLLVSSLNGIV